MSILVVKADGTTEPFDESKLLGSLKRSGASTEDAREVAAVVEKTMHDGITTSEIYHHAFAYLKEHRHVAAARYSLKRAVLDFGPSGFPFEAYLAEVFRAEGHTTKIDQIVQGGCVEHEVDVVLSKGGETTYVEAKFHNTAGFKTDVKVALYIKARMDDIAANKNLPQPMRSLLVTNTKFTDRALQYAECAGVELLGWEYPHKNNLHDRIDRARVYPITALSTLSRGEKDALLAEKVVLCNDISKQGEALWRAGIKGHRADALFTEAAQLCVPGKDI